MQPPLYLHSNMNPEYLPEKVHNVNYARRPNKVRGPSPLKKSFSSSQWEPQRATEDTFGYRQRNNSRSDSKLGIVNVEAVRGRSPEFYNDEHDRSDSQYF